MTSSMCLALVRIVGRDEAFPPDEKRQHRMLNGSQPLDPPERISGEMLRETNLASEPRSGRDSTRKASS
jgi:hypothetical protein